MLTYEIWLSRHMVRNVAYTILTACLSVASLQAAWRTEVIDPGGGGKFSTLLFDKNGNGHASYVDEQLHLLKYAFWDHMLQKWFVMTVDDHCDGFSSMALDSHQNPHIAYQPYGSPGIRYAHWDGSAWRRETIHVNASLVQFYTSIAITAHDYPIITYYEVYGPDGVAFQLHLCTVEWNGRYWESGTVDWTQGSGKFNSIAKGSHGALAIAYANVKYENASLRFARWTGNAWRISILEGASGPFPVYSVSMVFDEQDTPHITYTDVANRLVKYATYTHDKWNLETVDRLAAVSYPDRNGIALDAAGVPYISYYDSGLGALKVAHREDTRWISDTVDAGYSGFTSSLQIANNQIFVIYCDLLNHSLKCARQQLAAHSVSLTSSLLHNH
jgi:hypothetical protein